MIPRASFRVHVTLNQSKRAFRPRGCRPGAQPSLHLSKGKSETET